MGWFLRETDGVHTVGHGGSANGQFTELLLAPGRDFAVVLMANAGPDGIPFNHAVVRWALQTYLQVTDADPLPLAPRPGTGQRDHWPLRQRGHDAHHRHCDAGLWLEVLIRPEIRAAADKELPPDHAPFPFGLLPGDSDEYVITGGAFTGQRGFFTRNPQGEVIGVDLAGRLLTRQPATPH